MFANPRISLSMPSQRLSRRVRMSSISGHKYCRSHWPVWYIGLSYWNKCGEAGSFLNISHIKVDDVTVYGHLSQICRQIVMPSSAMRSFTSSASASDMTNSTRTDFLLCLPFIVPTLFYEMRPPASKPPSCSFEFFPKVVFSSLSRYSSRFPAVA